MLVDRRRLEGSERRSSRALPELLAVHTGQAVVVAPLYTSGIKILDVCVCVVGRWSVLRALLGSRRALQRGQQPSRGAVDEALVPHLQVVPSSKHNDLLLICFPDSEAAASSTAAPAAMTPTKSSVALAEAAPFTALPAEPSTASAATESASQASLGHVFVARSGGCRPCLLEHQAQDRIEHWPRFVVTALSRWSAVVPNGCCSRVHAQSHDAPRALAAHARFGPGARRQLFEQICPEERERAACFPAFRKQKSSCVLCADPTCGGGVFEVVHDMPGVEVVRKCHREVRLGAPCRQDNIAAKSMQIYPVSQRFGSRGLSAQRCSTRLYRVPGGCTPR